MVTTTLMIVFCVDVFSALLTQIGLTLQKMSHRRIEAKQHLCSNNEKT